MSKRSCGVDEAEILSSLKYRINNIIKVSSNQKVLETLLHMKRDIQEGKDIDYSMFELELREIEANQVTFDGFKKRYENVYKKMEQALKQIETIAQYAPSAFPVFEKSGHYLEMMKNLLISLPDFDTVSREDYLDYLDLLHRFEDWLTDYAIYIKKWKNNLN